MEQQRNRGVRVQPPCWAALRAALSSFSVQGGSKCLRRRTLPPPKLAVPSRVPVLMMVLSIAVGENRERELGMSQCREIAEAQPCPLLATRAAIAHAVNGSEHHARGRKENTCHDNRDDNRRSFRGAHAPKMWSGGPTLRLTDPAAESRRTRRERSRRVRCSRFVSSVH